MCCGKWSSNELCDPKTQCKEMRNVLALGLCGERSLIRSDKVQTRCFQRRGMMATDNTHVTMYRKFGIGRNITEGFEISGSN